MKVLYFTIGIDRLRGGARNSTASLYRALSKISDDIILVNYPGYIVDQLPSPLNAIYFGKKIQNFLKNRIDYYSPDLIHITGYSGFYFIPRNIKIPIIYTFRDDPLVGQIATKGYSFNLIQNFWTFYYKYISKCIMKIIQNRSGSIYFHSLSENMSNSMAKFGISPRKIIEIPNGFNKKTINTLQKPPISEINKITIGFVGALEYRKGFDRIIELAKQSPQGYRYLIVGDYSSLIFKLYLANFEIPDNIIFLGRISKIKIHKFYKKCDLIIIPSRSESFSNVVIESLTYNNLLIMTDTGISNSVTELENVKVLQYFDYNTVLDHIELLLNTKRQNNNFDWYSWNEIANRFLEIYKKIINSRLE